MHAMSSDNYEELTDSFAKGVSPAVPNDPKRREEFEKAVHDALARFRGLQIVAKEAVGDDRVDLTVLNFFEERYPDLTIQRMVREGSQWKFKGSYSIPQPTPSTPKNDQIQLFSPSITQ
jgi:hypothetical protein